MTDEDNPDSPDKVGYGKPPKHTRFVKGKSGNPKGRGKGIRNLATELQEELDSRVLITENGKRKTITKRKAVVKQLANKAAAGDPKAISVLLSETRLYESGSAGDPGSAALCRPEDQLVMANIVRRIREVEITDSDAPSDPTGEPPKPDDSSPEDGGTL